MITSTHNPRIQHARALVAQRKERDAAGEFVLEGVRLVEEALAAGWEMRQLFYAEGLSERGLALVRAMNERGVTVEEVAPHILKAISDTETPQGVVAIVAARQPALPTHPDFLLIADGIRDPGNLGTLLRSAAAAGVQAVLLPPGAADLYSPKVLRAAMGAHFFLPICPIDWPTLSAYLKQAGVQVWAAESGSGAACWSLDLAQPTALIVGSEAEGPSQPALDLAHGHITIPMPGGFESLNAAVAASILLFEIVRQRATRTL